MSFDNCPVPGFRFVESHKGKQSNLDVCLFLFLLACSFIRASDAFAEDKIQAERSETVRQGNLVLRNMAMVEAKFGSTEILADSARAWMKEGRYIFLLGVTYSDSVRRVHADTLEYQNSESLATFRGQVKAEEGGLSLSASQVRYRLDQDDLLATGNAVLKYEEERVVLEAQMLQYNTVGDSGRATGGARVIATPESGSDPLFLASDSLRFIDGGSRLDLSGRVTLNQGETSAWSGKAKYRRMEGNLVLNDGPRVTWQDSASVQDSVRILAEQISFKLTKGRIQSIKMIGSVDIQMDVHQNEAVDHRSILSDSSEIAIRKNQIECVQGWGSVTVELQNAKGSLATLSGDTLDMDFTEGDLDSLSIWGSFKGTHAGTDTSSFNRLSGDRNQIWFEEGQIHRIKITGEAVCEHSPNRESAKEIRLTGDQVDLIFHRGNLQQVYADGGVEGHYVPDGEEP